MLVSFFFFFSSRRRHTRFDCDWSSDVCSADFPFLYADASRLQVNAEITDCDQIWCRIFCSGGAAECCSRDPGLFIYTEGVNWSRPPRPDSFAQLFPIEGGCALIVYHSVGR